jgi:hypothetical protein
MIRDGMRGPLLSGPVGSPATLGRLVALAREAQPVVVLSALWLAEALSAELPVLVLIEPDKVRAARKALARARKESRKLSVVVAGEALPLAARAPGAVIVEGLTELDDEAAVELVADVTAVLRAGGTIISADVAKDPAAEGRLSGIFLAAPLLDIRQERPKEGALLTIGTTPPDVLLEALAPDIVVDEARDDA